MLHKSNMQRSLWDGSILLFLLAVFLFAAPSLSGPLLGQEEFEISPLEEGEFALYTDVYETAPGHVCRLPAGEYTEDHSRHNIQRLTPEELARLPQTANITVNYSGNWTAEARAAFEYAVQIWEATITSPVTIVVDAEFSSTLGSGVLGGAGPLDYARNFPNAPIANTWYPIALANSMAGSDLSPSKSDIDSAFSSTFNWYYGTDGQTPSNQIDFVSVVLHEIGHGLGFTGSFNSDGVRGYWGGNSPFPEIYDRYIENGSGAVLINSFSSGSVALQNQITSDSIYFDGPKIREYNNGDRASIYAPSNWSGGSSMAHVGEVYNGTGDALMTYSLNFGEAEHDPGPVVLGIFADMGWQVTALQVSPTGNNAGLILEAGTTQLDAFDLWALAEDDGADSAITFSLSNASNGVITATLFENRYLDVATSGTGELTVTVNMTDADNNTGSFEIKIISTNTLNRGYLPFTAK